MTRKDLKEKYNIIGENADIQLFRKSEDAHTGIGYCGNITLKNGKAVFNGKTYSDLDALDDALREWEKSLYYPVDTYCPMYNSGWQVESRIIWYLTEKMGFKAAHRGWDLVYERPIGPSFNLEFFIDRDKILDGKICVSSKYGEYHFRTTVDNAEDGITAINTIVNTSVLEMAKDMVDTLSVCDNNVTSEIETYIPSNKNIFGFQEVNFKELMIAHLEGVLQALKS